VIPSAHFGPGTYGVRDTPRETILGEAPGTTGGIGEDHLLAKVKLPLAGRVTV